MCAGRLLIPAKRRNAQSSAKRSLVQLDSTLGVGEHSHGEVAVGHHEESRVLTTAGSAVLDDRHILRGGSQHPGHTHAGEFDLKRAADAAVEPIACSACGLSSREPLGAVPSPR